MDGIISIVSVMSLKSNLTSMSLLESFNDTHCFPFSFDVEMRMREAQAKGDTYQMNICRDQISQLEKQVSSVASVRHKSNPDLDPNPNPNPKPNPKPNPLLP